MFRKTCDVPVKGTYAGFRALARLSMACRWLEWHCQPEALDQIDIAEKAANDVLDDVLREERVDLVNKMRRWIKAYGSNPAALTEEEALMQAAAEARYGTWIVHRIPVGVVVR